MAVDNATHEQAEDAENQDERWRRAERARQPGFLFTADPPMPNGIKKCLAWQVWMFKSRE